MFHYLLGTQDYYIYYKEKTQDISSFVYVSDMLFADNSLDWRSSQDYIMKLFSDAIAWRANKKDIVIISFTEVELLAVSQTAKKAIYLF